MNKDKERFESHINKTDTCWLWTAHLDKDGYGQSSLKGKFLSAHRLSYYLYKGEIPKGMIVMHSCDIPSCVNPEHLFLGTIQDNNADRNKKNRQAKGILCGNNKHSKDTIQKIRDMYNSGEFTQNELAIRFKTSGTNISAIVCGKTWYHDGYNKKHNGLNKKKLSINDVREIRQSNLSQIELAKKYNVTTATISRVLNNLIWNRI